MKRAFPFALLAALIILHLALTGSIVHGSMTAASEFADGLAIGPNVVEVTARHCQKYATPRACAEDPASVFYRSVGHNLKTNGGVDFISSQVSGTSSTNTAQWVALSTDSTTPHATDTTLPGEIASNGLSRAQATYAHTNGTTTYTLTELFTASGAQSGIWKTGVLTQSSNGTLVYEILLNSSVSLSTGDQLSVVWTVTIS